VIPGGQSLSSRTASISLSTIAASNLLVVTIKKQFPLLTLRQQLGAPLFIFESAPASLLLQRRYNVDGRFVPKCSGFVRPAFMRE